MNCQLYITFFILFGIQLLGEEIDQPSRDEFD